MVFALQGKQGKKQSTEARGRRASERDAYTRAGASATCPPRPRLEPGRAPDPPQTGRLISQPVQATIPPPLRLSPMADQDPLGIVGELIAEKYQIEHLVGEGGFAVVYRAKHVIWERPVAVKFFDGLSRVPNDYRETLQQQFVDEGALLTELSVQTPGIVQARDVGFYTTRDGRWVPYLVLEWLEGSSLEAVLEQDQRQGLPWTENEVIGFLRRVLVPLEVAHRHGVAHRDIKPANIFVLGSAARSADTPCKLLDFGVAKIVADHSTLSAALAKTGLSSTSFSPQYGAPEQFTRSYGATGPWTDVYAVALVATEMLAGRRALDGEDLVQLGFSSANPDRRPTPRALGARISDPLQAVFAKALAVQPGDRFANAGEFLKSTLAATEEAVPVGSVPPPPPASPAPRPSPEAAISEPPPSPSSSRESPLGILLVLLIVVGFGTVVYGSTDLPGAPEIRRVFAPMLQDARKLVRRLTSDEPTGAPKPNAASAMPAGTAAPPTVSPTPKAPELGPHECPWHTWRLDLSAPKTPSRTSTAPRRDAGAPAAVRCMDVSEVSELYYAACSKCDQPKTTTSKARTRALKTSEYCTTGHTPTATPIRCVSWKQAAEFCRLRGAGLPTRDELNAVGLGETSKGALPEWSTERPSGAPSQPRAFRCVQSR
jgi:eukaryotic-like serine/threonine-protein kinase